MRAKPIQIKALTGQIQNEFRGAFVFGPEESLVYQTAQQIAKLIVPDVKDDFCLLKTTAAILKENPRYLTEEANALSLMGGRKLLWMQEVNQDVLDPLKQALDEIQTDTFLLLIGGNIPSKSALCSFCVDHEKILTIPCYQQTWDEVAQLIAGILKENGFSCAAGALDALVQRLYDDPSSMNSELEKLMVYKGNEKNITVADVEFVVTQSSGGNFDDLCLYTAAGNTQKADLLCTLLLEETNPVMVLHRLSDYFHKLIQGTELMQTGLSPKEAAKKILRAGQFKFESPVASQLSKWKKADLIHVLESIFETEKQTKTTGLPADLIVQRFVLSLAQFAKKL